MCVNIPERHHSERLNIKNRGVLDTKPQKTVKVNSYGYIQSVASLKRPDFPYNFTIANYEDIEKKLARLPQFANTQNLFRCLQNIQLAADNRSEKLENAACTRCTYEIIIENQRGATWFGSKMYTNNSVLYPIDPPKYQTLSGKKINSISLYPDTGKWIWPKWHVLLINDVDEEGWIYSSIRFGSEKWSGIGKFGNFVRRRIWIRMAESAEETQATETLGIIKPKKSENAKEIALSNIIHVDVNNKPKALLESSHEEEKRKKLLCKKERFAAKGLKIETKNWPKKEREVLRSDIINMNYI